MRPPLGGHPRHSNQNCELFRDAGCGGPRRGLGTLQHSAPLVGTRKLRYLTRNWLTCGDTLTFTRYLNVEGEDEHITTSNTWQQTLKDSVRPSCCVLRTCTLASVPWPSRRGLRLSDLRRLFCALRGFDLHADREADHGQNCNRRHCDIPGGGLHMSDPFRSVDCQLGRRQHARFLRGAGTG